MKLMVAILYFCAIVRKTTTTITHTLMGNMFVIANFASSASNKPTGEVLTRMGYVLFVRESVSVPDVPEIK